MNLTVLLEALTLLLMLAGLYLLLTIAPALDQAIMGLKR